ncbi:hypothetical protein FRC12_006227 [Ceratobasidium sp. 428]|nr:hypothetical protein FRC12_006227 [Ceratobasidium sp. 428]
MSPSIPTVPLNDKRAIPAIAFGTGSALFGNDATTAVVQALEGGFNHIDTAQAYRNEESVGEALRQAFGKSYAPYGDEKIDVEGQTLGAFRREDIWITTQPTESRLPEMSRRSRDMDKRETLGGGSQAVEPMVRSE